MMPLFKSNTDNSIKNIFYSTIRSIVSRNKNEKTNNKKFFDLPILLKYYDIIYEETKKKFLEENPTSEKDIEEYLKNIENMLNQNPKKKYMDLDILKQQNKIKKFLDSDSGNENGYNFIKNKKTNK